jgi:shikimate kinase
VATVVVLLGPPGSGKTTVGGALAGCGFRWRDREQELVERWGSRDAFVANKADALPELHRSISEWLAESGDRAALETTGLSDAPLLEEVRRHHSTTVVRLDVSEATALARVGDRHRGGHLSDDPDDNRRVWHAFQRLVLPRVPVDLVVDTEVHGVDAATAMVLHLVEATR